ncbi:MAG: dihydropteroate synthase, partial [Acidimicrobiales bacterium]
TMRASVAARALAAGAQVVNDVSGGLADPGMVALVAEAGVPYVLMHWRGHSQAMADRAVYGDVVAEVSAALQERLAAVVAAGVAAEQVVLDPGLGFAKNAGHNWALLAHLDALVSLGRPVLVGASRKTFLGALLAESGQPRATEEREDATTAASALAAVAGAWGVRVHQVRASADAVRVAAAVRAAQ